MTRVILLDSNFQMFDDIDYVIFKHQITQKIDTRIK